MQGRLLSSSRLLLHVRRTNYYNYGLGKRIAVSEGSRRAAQNCSRRLYASQAFATASARTIPEARQNSSSNEVTTKAFELAGRILPVEEYEAWTEVLARIQRDSSKRRIGFLKNSGSQKLDLLTVLLADPLTQVDTLDALRKRLARSDEVLLSFNPETSHRPGQLKLPSSKLQEWDSVILETASPKSLFTTDIAVIPTSELPSPSFITAHPHIIQVQDLPGGAMSSNPEILTVDSEEAARALAAFRQGSVSDFQRLYLRSNLGQVQSAITEALKSVTSTQESRMYSLLLALLEDCSAELDGTKRQLRHAEDAARSQRASIVAAVEDLRQRYGLIPVEESCKRGVALFNDSIQNLRWWRFWELDSAMESVRTAIFTTYAAETEQKLAFFAGSLAAKQDDIERSTREFVSSLPARVKTAVLLNETERIQRQHHDLASNSLTGAVQHRRTQLATIAQPVLERSTWMGIVQGASLAGLSVAGHLGALAYAPELVETTIWLLAFGPLLGVRWVVGSWERAKKKWRKDVARIDASLKADIDTKLDNLLTDVVFKKHLQVVECVETGIRIRRETVDVLRQEIGALHLELTRTSQK